MAYLKDSGKTKWRWKLFLNVFRGINAKTWILLDVSSSCLSTCICKCAISCITAPFSHKWQIGPWAWTEEPKWARNVVFHYVLSTLFPLAFIQFFHQLLWIIFDKEDRIWEIIFIFYVFFKAFSVSLGKPCGPLFPSPLKIIICSTFPNVYWYCHGIPLKLWRIDDTKSQAVSKRLIFILSIDKFVCYQLYLWVIFRLKCRYSFRHNFWKTI